MKPAQPSLRLSAFGFLAFASILVADVGPVPDSLQRERKLDPFYQKHTAVAGFPILGSTNVSDAALREAAWILQQMLQSQAHLLQTLASNQVHLTVMAWNEYTTDVPEQRDMQPRVFWDRRARGLGGSPVSCGEENLLGYPDDPYATENLLIHEFAHALHEYALNRIQPSFDQRLIEAFQAATNRALWKGTYAGQNRHEYWAEAVQSWFDNNRENDALHNHVNTRAELLAYDPALAQLCLEVFGNGPWRYQKPSQRPPEQRAHLGDFNPTTAPRFRWRTETVPLHPRVLIQTERGDIEVELYTRQAPRTVTNFLHYVHTGLFSDGAFFRTVTADNQPTNSVKIAVVQAQANPARATEFLPPIPLERTRDSALQHLNGTLTMARDGPDSAQDSFAICVGPQPELDFGGQRNPDGQGFAAFGAVVKGMDIVRAIHQAPANGQLLTPPIRIQRAIRLN